jgi:hypothetical protein
VTPAIAVKLVRAEANPRPVLGLNLEVGPTLGPWTAGSTPTSTCLTWQ